MLENILKRTIKLYIIKLWGTYYMEKINCIMHTDYKPFNYYGSETAKYVIVAMGSVCDTIKLTINELNKENNIYGLIEVHL